MADTTKLAGMFPAWRLSFIIKPEYLIQANSRCVELGLQPKIYGFQDDRAVIRVFVPDIKGEKSCPLVFQKELEGFYGALVHAVKVQLLCPPMEQQ